MNLLINVLIAVVVFWLVWTYLLPLLPEPIRTVVLIVLVLVAIMYLFGFLRGGPPFRPLP